MIDVPGIVGVKEYFGVLPLVPDLNRAMFTARLKKPDATTDDLLGQIMPDEQVRKLSEEMSEAMRFMP